MVIIRKLVHFLVSLFTGDREFSWSDENGNPFK